MQLSEAVRSFFDDILSSLSWNLAELFYSFCNGFISIYQSVVQTLWDWTELVYRNIVGFFSFLWTFKDAIIVPGTVVEPLTSEYSERVVEEVDHVTPTHVESTSDYDNLLAKIINLEKWQKEEELKMSEIIASLKQHKMASQDHRLHFNSAMRRCCYNTCPSSTSESKLLNDLELSLADLKRKSDEEMAKMQSGLAPSLDMQMVKRMVVDAIRVYDADKTGRPDYALEGAGGRVVSIRCTKAYSNKAYNVLGMPMFWSPSSEPEDAIRPGTSPGQCWAFQGSVGFLALELSHAVYVTGFTMEHIPAALTPSGNIESAPKHFSVWGLNSADDIYDQYLFGEYIYQDSGETIQYFPVVNPSDRPFKFVELKIISNHGHPDYTCLYRIRVHGMVT